MRLILRWLATVNLRWADADLSCADFLRREIDETQDRAAARLVLASAYVERASPRR